MHTELVCWKCGASLKEVPQPLSRLSECLHCHAELYVCRICEFHDPKLRQGCLEERAEHVQEKERANFCDYLRPRPDAHVPRDLSKSAAAKAKLDAVFGGDAKSAAVAPAVDQAQEALERLFGAKPKA